MLCWILNAGGLLIMMGQHDRSEALFYYFRLEDQVPETQPAAAHRKAHQLCLCARKAEGQLQRDRAAVDRPRASATHSADRLIVRVPPANGS